MDNVWYSNVMLYLNALKSVQSINLGEQVRKAAIYIDCEKWGSKVNEHFILIPISTTASLISATIFWSHTLSTLKFNLNIYGRNQNEFEKIATWKTPTQSTPDITGESMFINPNSWLKTIREFCEKYTQEEQKPVWERHKEDGTLYLGFENTTAETISDLKCRIWFEYIETAVNEIKTNGLS